MEHVDENRLVWFLRGELTDRGIDDVESHLDACETCRDLFAVVAASSLLPAGAPAADPSDELAIGAQVGRYTLTRRLGSGGMGVVYAARDPQLEREVAVKLLRPGAADQDQLLREARVLAKLSHPNVVAVHDVGSYGDQLFVAMELVDTDAPVPRQWRAVVDVFRQVGEGLAAAHAAGVIHRDIKPANIRIGADGRARVLDFGLARRIELPQREVAGTPAYMAPEQLAGRGGDARSDQFSFCVAFYEALYGERPFAGLAGPAVTIRPPTRAVPAWVRRVVVRGLAIDPRSRHRDMRALVDALSPQRRRWIVPAAAAVVIGVAGVAYARTGSPCTPALPGVWDLDRRVAVQAALRDPYTFARVDARLTAYTASLIAARQDACEACRVRGEQSESILDRRNACLDDRQRAIAALTDELVHTTAVELAADAAAALPAVERCADPRWLPADDAPPATVAVAAELARIDALGKLGKLAEARTAAAQAVEVARAIGHRATLARSLVAVGLADTQAGAFEPARDELRQAVLAAEAGNDDATRVAAWLATANLAERAGHFEDGASAATDAAAIVERIGGDRQLAQEVAYYRGSLAYDLGHYADAEAALRRAGDAAEPLQMLALVLAAEGKPADALATHERVIALTIDDVGPSHPHVADAFEGRGAALAALGRVDDAIADYRRALAIREAALGPDDRRVAIALANIADALAYQNKFADARPLIERALAIDEHALGPDHPRTADALVVAARVHLGTGDAAAAERDAARAVAIRLATVGADHPDTARALDEQGAALVALGRPVEAIDIHRRALAILERGPDPLDVAETSVRLGEALLAAHRRDEAIAALERAVTIREVGHAPTEDLEAARAALARARNK